LWGLLRRRQCLVPTWRGWLALLLGMGILAFVAARTVHPFLALNASQPGGAMVVEGGMPDYALEEAVAEFNRTHYDKLFVTGGPLEHGNFLIEYKTAAELGAARLLKLGLTTNVVQAVPAPWVRQDRTYTAALALKHWLRDHGLSPARFNLISVGPHARRSRLLFEKALGKGVTVGVMAIPSRDYDAARWWRSSQGFRTVTSEAIAYAYARLFFRPGGTGE